MTLDDSLPLGWCWRSPAADLSLNSVALPDGKTFLHCADVPAGLPLQDLAVRLREAGPRDVILKGVSRSWAQAITAAGGTTLLLGHSARLDLAGWRGSHKARNLCRKGEKSVAVEEVLLESDALARGNELLRAVRGEDEPSIKLAYRTKLEDSIRTFFALEHESRAVAGLGSLTRYREGAWHVEQLARRPDAPAGTMEKLIFSVAELLRAEGADTLNLGEVPMYFPEESEDLGWLNRQIVRLAPTLAGTVRARYDVRGLAQFKQKFDPVWEPRSFASLGSLGLGDMFALAKLSGALGLLA